MPSVGLDGRGDENATKDQFRVSAGATATARPPAKFRPARKLSRTPRGRVGLWSVRDAGRECWTKARSNGSSAAAPWAIAGRCSRLYELTAPKLYGVSLRILGHRGDAEDAAQEAFVKVWQNAARYQAGRGSAAGWLVAIARNAAIDRLRVRKAPARDLSEMIDLADFMLAAERGVELRWIPLTDDFRLDLSDLDADARRRQAARDQRDVERARHDQRDPAARRRRPRARRARARRRMSVRAARRHRRPGVGRRLRRVLRAQAARSERHRCALGALRAARRDASVPRRRRDDPRRARRRLHAERRAVEVRSRDAGDRRGDRLRRRGRLPVARSAWSKYGTTRCG